MRPRDIEAHRDIEALEQGSGLRKTATANPGPRKATILHAEEPTPRPYKVSWDGVRWRRERRGSEEEPNWII